MVVVLIVIPVANVFYQALANGLGTNWGDVPGSTETNQVSVPINPTNDSVFFRLLYP